MHGQNDDPDLGELGFDDPGGINTIHDGHAYIHQHYVWSVLFYGLNGSQSIPCLRNDLEVVLFLKKVGDGISVMQVVVNDDNSERCVGIGIICRTLVPKRLSNRKPYLASMGWILYLKGKPKLVRISDSGIPIQGTYIGD
jgi:hypothetical protein